MSFDIRYPNITGHSEKEQLIQVKNYLHQLADQLQWAFNTINTAPSSSNVIVHTPQSVASAKNNTDAQATFNGIKGLIINSADIVNSYYEQINRRIEGSYVAESDFGTFIEQTTRDISETSTGIEQTFTHIQSILTNLKNIEHTLIETNAHINSGILYYDEKGIPVYGLEIGQKNVIDGKEVFNKYARFISDRLSFYDQNGTEVAYISDYKLYITNVEITGNVKGGAFLLDMTKGWRLKYVGRG